MKVEFNRTGADRKALVTAVSEILGKKAKYMGMPSAAYDFGGLIVDKTGSLVFEENIFPKDIKDLLDKLSDRGFTASCNEEPETSEERPQEENLGLTVAMPIESVSVGNLTNLLEAKGSLIKKALGVDDIRIEIEEEKVLFPWFRSVPDEAHSNAYLYFITAICKLSKDAKRISAKEKEVTNEKYAFRCFLLRLGMIGDNYKAIRKILLENLNGSSAFKSGKKTEVN